MKAEAKELLSSMYDMAEKVEGCISILQTAFINNSTKPLMDCIGVIEAVKKAEPELTRKITEIARDNPDLKPYISVPVHVLRISEHIEKLAELFGKKIRENLLFSDRAVTEVTFLLQRLSETLRPTSDIILARNTIMSRYVNESEINIANRANEYATFHEERLIEGLCLPAASALYINILDAIKGIAWHAKEIAVKLA